MSSRIIQHLLRLHSSRTSLLSSSTWSSTTTATRTLCFLFTQYPTNRLAYKTLQKPCYSLPAFSLKQRTCETYYSSSLTPRFFNTTSTDQNENEKNTSEEELLQCEWEEEGGLDGWEEEEEEVEAKIGDGGDGGGVVLQGVPWGERVLSLARDVLLGFGDDMKLFAFKTTPRGYVYVRLDKLSNEYGCPNVEELESYCQEYKKKLEEVGALGEIPDDLALEVSSPGAERILKVPDDLTRFKDMPMRVCYLEGGESNFPEKDGIFFLDSIETESENCVWKLADVKENRDPASKGRPLSRKRRDWRLTLPFKMHRRVTLYLEF